MHFLLWVLVGLIAGWLTGKTVKGHGYGPLVDMVMGVAGAVGGGFAMRFAGFSGPSGTIFATLAAITGAIILTASSAWASGRGRYARL